MSISLFEHNRIAYDSAVSMLAENGKAAIIHPTGTGKSFIGFKLCDDNPTANICWLSPSEYIFKTQLENLAATGADVPKNITFLTYAKLMLMGEDELRAILPNYIILDEFHRCGAAEWGKGVQNLLNMYSDVPILGLSATNIRYLDNQRDMADELFDGNIASEMTLGEAIVRGILNTPTYIISVYSYQKDLAKYKARIRRAKNKAARDAAEQYFESLRRALEKADGLDEVFRKHITDKSGKYIAFCANLENMDEMISHIPEWFSKVDRNPHVYQAYSDDPKTSKAFADFKKDHSEHLKLLFCIDMLNEGIHVEDVDGVILFRPTVSPIIYKQQIGRALSTGKSKAPVIFDIVNNFENLYSVGTIEQEMQAAITYYRFRGEPKNVVTDKFKIIDETRDCRKLFDALNETLTASWDLMYDYAKQYYADCGNLRVPYKYKTPEGYSLGSWLHTQRKVRSGEMYGKLNQDRIAKLDAIGMIWSNYKDVAWERYYGEAKQYFDEHNDLNTNVNYITPSGFSLGRWICQMRVYRKNGIQKNYLTEERVAMLDTLHMIWDVPDYLWENNFAEAMAYYREHGDLDVPYRYTSENGIKLGVWVRNLRRIREGRSKGAKLTNDQIERLNSIGMLWDDKFTRQWEYGYRQAVAYREVNGNLNVPATYVTENGFPLGKWLRRHTDINPKTAKTEIKLTPERRQRLTALGMQWDEPQDSWEMRYALAKAYFEEHGDLNIAADYVKDSVWLGKWIDEQRQIRRGKRKGKTLTPEQIQRLNAISFDWLNKNERAWETHYREAQRVYEATGSLVELDGVAQTPSTLRRWLLKQRKAYQDGKLMPEQIEKLNRLHFEWEIKDSWEENYAALYNYYLEHGNVKIPMDYTTPKGIKLYSWLSNQKTKCAGKSRYGMLTQRQIERLNLLGIGNRKEVKHD